MEIGKKIKALRLGKGLTQDKLAQELGVTPQAVSKWEKGTAMPDITLLPALSVCFGVRIDDFFALSDEAELDRIDNMAEAEFLSREDFEYAQRFLKDRIADAPGQARPYRSLAHLYNHRAMGYRRKAEKLVKRAIELEPTVKAGHSILSYAAEGACWDWCSCNHRELIDYYYDFVKKNPDYRPGYQWLMDNLLADGRLDEAEEAAERMARLGESCHARLYLGHIAQRRGDREKAEALWQEMVDREPDNWLVWSCLGDARVKDCDYEEALVCYHRAAELEQAPRYVDNWDSIAQVCEMLGRWEEAAEAYEKEIGIYREDWQTADAEDFYVSECVRKRLACLERAAKQD